MNQERLIATLAVIALKIKKQGGNRMAQETAAFCAKDLLKEGKSAATAIDQGVKAGIKFYKRYKNNQYSILA